LSLLDCRITNAVRCVPPQNKPTPEEARTCRAFLAAEIAATPRLAAILALGQLAHDEVLSTLGQRRAAFRFKHGARHALANGLVLTDSYHCSRYNTNTGVLTAEMFERVLEGIRECLR
ncbi:MAG: uracil-DNA glycosylase family protein, partial [Alphaproteobacteria bacterium]